MEVAIELVAADLANADTLDFRITQSDATVLNTYTVTPRITVSKVNAYTLDAAVGSYAVTGVTTLEVATLLLNATPGSYSTTGASVIPSHAIRSFGSQPCRNSITDSR